MAKKIERDSRGTPVGFRAVRLELPLDVHKALRIEAARQEVSMGALARVAVEEYLSKAAPMPKGGK